MLWYHIAENVGFVEEALVAIGDAFAALGELVATVVAAVEKTCCL